MYQTTIIAGRLGQEPEMRYAPSGDAVTNLSVATNRKYTDKNGNEVNKTCWFRVSVWGKQAEAANQYLHKGDAVLVEGELQSDPSTGGPKLFQKKDDSWGSSFEIRANHITFLPKGDKSTSDEEDL